MTAVQQLIYDMRNVDMSIFNDEHCKKYLEMEKQQMITFYVKGCKDTYGMDEGTDDVKDGERYYNETYGSKGSDVAKRLIKEMPKHIADKADEYAEKLVTSSKTEISDYDVEKLAEIEYPIFDGNLLGIAHNQQHRRFGFMAGYNKAKEK